MRFLEEQKCPWFKAKEGGCLSPKTLVIFEGTVNSKLPKLVFSNILTNSAQ